MLNITRIKYMLAKKNNAIITDCETNPDNIPNNEFEASDKR
jgi:hypothetical protein